MNLDSILALRSLCCVPLLLAVLGCGDARPPFVAHPLSEAPARPAAPPPSAPAPPEANSAAEIVTVCGVKISTDATTLRCALPTDDLASLRRLSRLERLSIDTDAPDVSPIAELGALRVLDLGASRLQSLQPLAGLTRLQGLRVRGRFARPAGMPVLDLGGEVRPLDLSGLQSLSELRVFEIALAELSDVSPLRALGKAQAIVIGDSVRVPGPIDLSPFSGLSALEHLDATAAPAVDVSPLVAVTRLSRLFVDASRISDVAPLERLKSLRTLEARGLRGKAAASLARLGALTELNLGRARLGDYAVIGKLTNLRNLSLERSDLQRLDFVRDLRALEVLSISNTRVTSLTPLEKLPALVQLSAVDIPARNFSPLLNITTLRVVWLGGEALGPPELNLPPDPGFGSAITTLKKVRPTLDVREVHGSPLSAREDVLWSAFAESHASR